MLFSTIFSIENKMTSFNKLPKFVFREIKGDLFSASKAYSLAHCVAVDLRMGAGIATAFRDKFGQIKNLKEQRQKVGGVAVLKDNDRFIYYLVTKSHSYKKPTYEDLLLSLKAMKRHMIKENVRKLAIPRIGCGLDRLQWKKVRKQLLNVFANVDMEIVVYTL